MSHNGHSPTNKNRGRSAILPEKGFVKGRGF